MVAVIDQSSVPGFHSRYSRPLIVADFQTDPASCLQSLLEEGKKLKEKGILFPSSDRSAIFLFEHYRQLGEYFEFTIPQEGKGSSIVDKRYQYQEAARVGTPIPPTFYPSTIQEIEKIKDILEYPVFIKPYYSHEWQRKFQSKGSKVENPQQLLEAFKEILPTGLQVMVQSIIPGPISNLFELEAYVGKDGKILGTFGVQKIRQFPSEFGMGTMVRSFHNKEVLRLGTDFLHSIGFRGIANIEFKLDDRDGKYKLIEINPRFWLQSIQPTQAGINFPLIEYLELTNQPIPVMPDYKDDVLWLSAASDLLSRWSTSHSADSWLSDFIRSWLKADCFAYFCKDDPKPALYSVLSPSALLPHLQAVLHKAEKA